MFNATSKRDLRDLVAVLGVTVVAIGLGIVFLTSCVSTPPDAGLASDSATTAPVAATATTSSTAARFVD